MSVIAPFEFLLRWSEDSPDATALIINGRTFSYASMMSEVLRCAGFFKENGVVLGSKVAIYSDDDLVLILSLFASWALGAVGVPMNVSHKSEKLGQIERIVGPNVGFYSNEYHPDYERSFPMVEVSYGSDSLSETAKQTADGLGLIMFTSGTSGVPKAVPLTNSAIAHNAYLASLRLRAMASDRLLVNTPMYTTSSIIHVLTMLSQGASVVVERGFLFGSSILDQIKKYNCTGFGGVPVHFSRLLATFGSEEIPPSLRFLMNSGDHLPAPIIRSIRDALPSIEIHCFYGLTEVAGRLCSLPPEKIDEKTGSVGFPFEGMKVTIRDLEGRELPPNVEGEIHVNGPYLMSGYLNNPETNDKVMKPYGFSTGDFGYMDEDGYLFLRGRHDDIFKVGGEKVSVKEIEDAIFGIEAFEEFMVAPAFDEHMGNVPVLYYVLKEGMELNKKNMLRRLKSILPPTHVPAKFIQVKSIPRTSSGKAIRT